MLLAGYCWLIKLGLVRHDPWESRYVVGCAPPQERVGCSRPGGATRRC
jgi:hypothetical protein